MAPSLPLLALGALIGTAMICAVLKYRKRRRQEHARNALYESADRPFRFLPETPDSSAVLTPPTQRSSGCMSTLQSAGQAAIGAFGGETSTPERRWLNAELSTDVQATQRLIQEELMDEDDNDFMPQSSSCRGSV